MQDLRLINQCCGFQISFSNLEKRESELLLVRNKQRHPVGLIIDCQKNEIISFNLRFVDEDQFVAVGKRWAEMIMSTGQKKT